jgi:excisionase family DNA binding protein
VSTTKAKSAATSAPGALLTYKQAAERLAISERQAKRYVEEGWLGSVRMPRGRRISEADIAAFIERNHQPAA